MKTLRSTLALFLALGMVFSFAACSGGAAVSPSQSGSDTTKVESGESSVSSSETGSGSSEEVTITYFTAQSTLLDVYYDMADALYKKEKIRVEFQAVPDDQYYVLAKTKVATNEVPDIIEYNTPSNNIELGAQDNCIVLNDEAWFSRLVNPTLLADPQDGKCYAMPLQSSGCFLAWYFNADKLKELGVSTEQPATWADFIARCDEILQKSDGKVAPISMAASDSWTVQIFPVVAEMMTMYPNEKEICAKLEKNELKWNEIDGFTQCIQTLFDMKKYYNTDFLSTTFDMSEEKVANGECAMAMQTESFAQDINTKFPNVNIGSWICNYKDQMILPIGAFVRGLFVMKDGKHVDETLRFLNLWSQPEYQSMRFVSVPGLPAFKDCESGKMLDCVTSLVNNYVPTNKYAVNMNDILSTPSSIYPELWLMYVDMLSGGLTPKELMDDWQAKYEDYMKERGMKGF
jgi:raffinose/stachyose/melibiose transport system substrate-binding protein